MKCQAVIVLTLTVSVFAQQPGKKTSVPAQSSSTALKLSPAEVKQRMLKLVAGHQPATIAVPIALTRAKLQHQNVLLKLQKQKQTVETLRMTLISEGGAPQQSTAASSSKGGAAVSQGAKPKQSMASQSKVTPVTNAGVVQSGSTTRVSPVINPNISTVAVCHGPTISAVNGQATGAWFTPDAQYNHYTIQGCGFGGQQGSLHLYGPFASHMVNMAVEFWSDTSIVAFMDPNISGESDYTGNVTLVVAPVNGPQAQAQGFNFYAARAEVQLTSIPQSQANLPTIPDAAGENTVSINFHSPTSFTPGAMAEVARTDWGRFGSAGDSFSFNQLAPGFYPDKAQFWHRDLTTSDCYTFGTNATLYTDGNWNVTWDDSANALRVTTQEQHCHRSIPTGNLPFGPHTSDDFSLSDYAIAVWVVGPRGVNPWPGNLQ